VASSSASDSFNGHRLAAALHRLLTEVEVNAATEEDMGLKRILVGSVLGAVLFAGGVAVGQIDPQRHPNLSAAHDFIGQAIQKIDAAQAASKERLGGHGERAKELLHQADHELMQAALYTDHRHK